MKHFEAMSYRKAKGDSFALVCEAINGNRFIVKQISRKGTDAIIRLSDGTTAKPEALKLIERVYGAKEMQKFLLKQ